MLYVEPSIACVFEVFKLQNSLGRWIVLGFNEFGCFHYGTCDSKKSALKLLDIPNNPPSSFFFKGKYAND